MLAWQFAKMEEFSSREWYEVTVAREAVFVVEQDCAFLDADGADPACWHLVGRLGAELAAYCRIVPPGLKFAEPSIGRVLTTGAGRGTGAGRALMDEAIARCERLFPGRPIRIGAQQYLERFYGGFGFATVSEPYDEDGIPHVTMLREPPGKMTKGQS
jgi:ElaA protein